MIQKIYYGWVYINKQDLGVQLNKVVDFWVGVFNATFNNISVILWQSVLLVEETNDLLAASHWQSLSHNVVSSTPHHEQDSNSQI